MGWQEARTILIPASTEYQVELFDADQESKGVEVIDFNRDAEATSYSIGTVSSYLTNDYEFKIKSDAGSMQTLVWHDVVFKLHQSEDTLKQITAEFKLEKASSENWAQWCELINDLCKKFEFVIFDLRSKTKVSPDRLLHVLSKTKSWQNFAKQFDWPDVGEF